MVIGRCNGAVLVEEGKRVSLVQQPGEHLPTAFFVAGLTTLVLGANGLLQLFMNPLVGVGLLSAAVAAGVTTLRVKRRIASRNASPVRAAPRLVFDFEARSLTNESGVVLAPLGDLRLERALQIFSSSRALRLAWPSDSVVIARGNPFGDHVGEIEDALQKRGIRVAS